MLIRPAHLLLLLLVLVQAVPLAFAEEERRAIPEAAVEALRNSVVMAYVRERGSRADDGGVATCGTGFVLRSGGFYLVSNVHVGGSQHMRSISQRDLGRYELIFEPLEGQITRRPMQRESQQQDIIWYRLAGSPIGGIDRVRRFEDLEEGETVYSLGNRGCSPWTWGGGTIISKLDRSSRDPAHARQIDELLAALQATGAAPSRERYNRVIVADHSLAGPGNSGGPIVDEHGRLVGVVWAAGPAGAYIIPVEYVYRNLGTRAPRTSPERGPLPRATSETWGEEDSTAMPSTSTPQPPIPPTPARDPFAPSVELSWEADDETGSLRAVEEQSAAPTPSTSASVLLRYRLDRTESEAEGTLLLVSDPSNALRGASEIRWREGNERRRLAINDLGPREQQARLRRTVDGMMELQLPAAPPPGTEYELRTGDGRTVQLWPQRKSSER